MSIIEDENTQGNNIKSEHGETLETLTSDNNFQKKTNLGSFEQAYAYGTLWSIANQNDIMFLKDWLKNVSDWAISIEGSGRKDIVEVSRYKAGGGMPLTEKLLDKFDK